MPTRLQQTQVPTHPSDTPILYTHSHTVAVAASMNKHYLADRVQFALNVPAYLDMFILKYNYPK